jgi:hypothetical protein
MNIIAAECAVKKHHPEWSNVSDYLLDESNLWALLMFGYRYTIQLSYVGQRTLLLACQRRMWSWRGIVMGKLRFVVS